MSAPNKSLGQHWLKDRVVLAAIADEAEINSGDTVLEIGSGLGTLTSELLRRAKQVTAVEFDAALAAKLPGQFPGTSLTVVNEDILKFDLSTLPTGYKVVANVPYYITSKIIERLMTTDSKPSIAVLLVQKEVAERLAAQPGDMSILAVSAQMYAEVTLGDVVPAAFFTPPPKVDSQVVVLRTRTEPLVTTDQERDFFRLIHAGFAERRKKLRSSLSGGLRRDKAEIDTALHALGLDADARAQELSIEEWLRLGKKLGIV